MIWRARRHTPTKNSQENPSTPPLPPGKDLTLTLDLLFFGQLSMSNHITWKGTVIITGFFKLLQLPTTSIFIGNKLNLKSDHVCIINCYKVRNQVD